MLHRYCRRKLFIFFVAIKPVRQLADFPSRQRVRYPGAVRARPPLPHRYARTPVSLNHQPPWSRLSRPSRRVQCPGAARARPIPHRHATPARDRCCARLPFRRMFSAEPRWSQRDQSGPVPMMSHVEDGPSAVATDDRLPQQQPHRVESANDGGVVDDGSLTEVIVGGDGNLEPCGENALHALKCLLFINCASCYAKRCGIFPIKLFLTIAFEYVTGVRVQLRPDDGSGSRNEINKGRGAEREILLRVHKVMGIMFKFFFFFKCMKFMITRAYCKIIMKNLNNKITFYCICYTTAHAKYLVVEKISRSISKLTWPILCFYLPRLGLQK